MLRTECEPHTGHTLTTGGCGGWSSPQLLLSISPASLYSPEEPIEEIIRRPGLMAPWEDYVCSVTLSAAPWEVGGPSLSRRDPSHLLCQERERRPDLRIGVEAVVLDCGLPLSRATAELRPTGPGTHMPGTPTSRR